MVDEIQLERVSNGTDETQTSTDSEAKLLKGNDEMVVSVAEVTPYRLYRARFVGLTGLVLLNIVAAMAWPWFGPISTETAAEFNITLDQVNWLGNVVACVYLPTAFLIPIIVSRWGLRRCCEIGGVALILGSWIRYAGTAKSLSPGGAYALLFFGQVFAAIAQPLYQVIGAKYSESWFDLNGRTTATMVAAIANPVGGALGQLISPLISDVRQSILVLGIISTCFVPCIFMIKDAPPTPPTYAASKPKPSPSSLVYAMLGKGTNPDAVMTQRERLDFALLVLVFGTLVAGTNAFAILTSQIFEPHGYSSDEAGFFGACLLLTGIISAIVTAPLFDRVFTYHLALTARIVVPIIAIGWLSLIWAVKPNNLAGLFVIMTIIGVGSITMLPVALELACEITRNADGSSAILWAAGNLFGIIFILSEQALRAGPDANPPLNMKRSLIFNGVFILVASAFVLLIQGQQQRKRLDEEKKRQQQDASNVQPSRISA